MKKAVLILLWCSTACHAAVPVTPHIGAAKLIYFDDLASAALTIQPFGEPPRAIPNQRCLGGYSSWTVGSKICEGFLPQTSEHIIKRATSTNGSSGTADFKCTITGAYIVQPGAICT